MKSYQKLKDKEMAEAIINLIHQDKLNIRINLYDNRFEYPERVVSHKTKFIAGESIYMTAMPARYCPWFVCKEGTCFNFLHCYKHLEVEDINGAWHSFVTSHEYVVDNKTTRLFDSQIIQLGSGVNIIQIPPKDVKPGHLFMDNEEQIAVVVATKNVEDKVCIKLLYDLKDTLACIFPELTDENQILFNVLKTEYTW